MTTTTPSEKANCVGWYFETKSIIKVQRKFRIQYNKKPPSRNSIVDWHRKFLETGSVLDRPRSGRPSTSEGNVARIQQTFSSSPTLSTRNASRQLGIPRTTIAQVLHKRLQFQPYKVQLLQALHGDDKPRRFNFTVEMLERIDANADFLRNIIFTDEATFHVSGVVNRQNLRIWGTENPHHVVETIRDSPKVNVWCGLMCDRIIGPFFFAEPTVTKESYLDMIQIFAIPQVCHLHPNVFWQQDGAPPHWGKIVRDFLNEEFPGRWLGRDGPLLWPPRSPDLTPLDFFLWGYVKDKVYSSPVADIGELKRRITQVIQSTQSMLANTWREIEYRLDVVRATSGAHIEIW